MTNEQRRAIYAALRDHPNGAREAERIARNMPGNSPTERIARAQEATIDFVNIKYRGNTKKFLEDYSKGHIDSTHIVQLVGRQLLDLSLQ